MPSGFTFVGGELQQFEIVAFGILKFESHDACRSWAAARNGPTLLVQTEPSKGLDEPHAAELRAWAAAL